MSRSNPTSNNTPNPAGRIFEWKGSKGKFVYYDREKEENVTCSLPFVFLVLDQLATIRGYSKKSGGLYSNEVRDTRSEPLIVKFFKGGKIAEGFYADIKDRVNANSGHYTTKCYIAYKDEGKLKLGAIMFGGCALGPWIEFCKENRKNIQEKAVAVKESKNDCTGSIEFNSPVFSVMDITPESDAAAKALDVELQAFLKIYFGTPRTQQVEHKEPAAGEEPHDHPPEGNYEPEPEDGVDVPF